MSWDETVATLLVGTDRRPGLTDAELLRTLATEGTRRRAGATVSRTDQTVLPAPPESLPECSPKAAQLLELVLTDHFGKGNTATMAGIWLERCAAAGRIAPAGQVPALLDLGASDSGLRDRVRQVVGERGRWVAAMSGRWAWAATGPADLDAASTPISVMEDSLTAARRADPDAGRDRIANAVEGLAAADRAQLYSALAEGLSPDDEPLLEELLDERSQKIRDVASLLLSRLPGSAWAGRMIERIAPLVVVKRLGTRFDVELPESLDDQAARDGIVEKPPRGVGRQAWWLQQIVASVPLGWWESAVGAEPHVIAQKAPVAEVRAGWQLAARRQLDRRWATALFDAQPAVELVPLMTEKEAVDRLIAACRGSRPFTRRPGFPQLGDLLVVGPALWPPDLSKAVVEVVAGQKGELKGAGPLLGLLGRADPAVIDRLVAVAGRLSDFNQRAVRTAINQITFRQSLDEEFT